MSATEKIEFTVSEIHEVLIHLVDFEAVCSTLPKILGRASLQQREDLQGDSLGRQRSDGQDLRGVGPMEGSNQSKFQRRPTFSGVLKSTFIMCGDPTRVSGGMSFGRQPLL